MSVCNIGCKPTYDCPTGKTIIDATIASYDLTDRISEWRVHDKDYFSDHKLITFKFNLNIKISARFRNFKKANWPYFTSLLAKKKWTNPPKTWSKETIETEVEKLNSDNNRVSQKVPNREQREHWEPLSNNLKSA